MSTPPLPLRVLKFGGTSVGSEDRIRTVARIVKDTQSDARPVVVVSAASGVTDALVLATTGAQPWPEVRAFVSRRYRVLATSLLAPTAGAIYALDVEAVLSRLDSVFSHVGSDSALSKAATDDILSAGERLSVPLIARYLEAEGVPARATDATPLIRILTDGSVDHATTEHLIRSWACTLGPGVVPVITGYVASKASGATATLGRGGSDYTAALFASALDAAWMERWTDVDGIYTADPRRHPEAERYERLTLAEAYRLNRTGGLGMHRDALGPLVRAGIPLRIRSTKEPEKAGTAIV